MDNLYLLTGGNIGDRIRNLENASEHLQLQIGTILQKSSVYETEPWGIAEQALFLNQVLCIQTTLSAQETLKTILQIENQLGRTRMEKNGPRIIDIDILFYNDEIISATDLQVPHPEIANRRFVLTPLNEIAPAFVHPVLQKRIAELLAICQDKLEVKKYISQQENI